MTKIEIPNKVVDLGLYPADSSAKAYFLIKNIRHLQISQGLMTKTTIMFGMEAMCTEYVMDQVIHARRAFLTKSN